MLAIFKTFLQIALISVSYILALPIMILIVSHKLADDLIDLILKD